MKLLTMDVIHGRFAYGSNVSVFLDEYESGHPLITLKTPDGSPLTVVTVDMSSRDLFPSEGNALVLDNLVNEGVASELEYVGVLGETRSIYRIQRMNGLLEPMIVCEKELLMTEPLDTNTMV